jgi:hypothetical protein
VDSRRRKTLGVGFALFVLMGLFPPWEYTFNAEWQGVPIASSRPAGYALIFLPPKPLGSSYVHGVRLDFGRLLVQWVLVAGVTGVVLAIQKPS